MGQLAVGRSPAFLRLHQKLIAASRPSSFASWRLLFGGAGQLGDSESQWQALLALVEEEERGPLRQLLGLARQHRELHQRLRMQHRYRNVLAAFTGWRNSGGHWASIASDAPEVGFGYALSKSGTPYWVAVYGYPTAADKQAEAKLLEHRTEVAAAPVEPPKPAAVTTAKVTRNTQPTYSYSPPQRRGLFRLFRR